MAVSNSYALSQEEDIFFEHLCEIQHRIHVYGRCPQVLGEVAIRHVHNPWNMLGCLIDKGLRLLSLPVSSPRNQHQSLDSSNDKQPCIRGP